MCGSARKNLAGEFSVPCARRGLSGHWGMRDDDARPFADFDAGYQLMAWASTGDLSELLTVSATSDGRPVATTYRFSARRRAWVQEVVTVGGRTVAVRGSTPGVRTLAPPHSPDVVQAESGATIEVCLSFGADMGPDRAVGAPPESGAASVALYEWVDTDAESDSSSVSDSRP
jgi:hypothetical protein